MTRNMPDSMPAAIKLAHALAWLILFALVAVPFAWGDEYHYGESDRYQTDRSSQTEMDAMRQFLDYEAAAVELAKAGASRTHHNEMRDYCNSVVEWGTQRINRVHEWMDRWYGVHYEPRMDETFQSRLSDLRNPNVRNEEFEIRLLKYSIEQHQREASAMQQFLPYISRDQLAGTLQDVINRRQENARRLQGWLKTWYDINYTAQYAPYGQGLDRRHEHHGDYRKYDR